MNEPRESIRTVLLEWRLRCELARGIPEDRARQIAKTDVNEFLGLTGGRPWYHPRSDTQIEEALAFRDDAIRRAHSGGATYLMIKRSFHVSRGHYYRIINGRRNGHKGNAA